MRTLAFSMPEKHFTTKNLKICEISTLKIVFSLKQFLAVKKMFYE